MNEQAPISQSIQHRNLLCLMGGDMMVPMVPLLVLHIPCGQSMMEQWISARNPQPTGPSFQVYKSEILLTTHQGILGGFHCSIIDGPHGILTRLGRYVVFYKVTRQEFNWSVNASSQAYETVIRYVLNTVNPLTV